MERSRALKLLGVLALLGGAYWLLRPKPDTSSESARELVKEGALLLDVRTPGEFAAGHLPGALNVPLQELEGRLEELGAKDKPIVVYCRSGNRSGRAKGLLSERGFSKLHDLGAMSRW